MTPTAQILFAVIGTGIAIITLLATILGFMWKSIDQRFTGVDRQFKGIDQRFTDLEKLFDARLETIRVEINQLAHPPLVRP
jgi:hypothetical protein